MQGQTNFCGEHNEYVPKSALGAAYGLTPAMIEELGGPDGRGGNPRRRGRPAGLYRVERVEAWVRDNQKRLGKANAERPRRSAAAKAANERRREAGRLREAEA